MKIKKTVFCLIIEKRYPEFIKKHPKLSADLSDIGTSRNILAHWLLDTSDSGVESNEFRFVKIKNVSNSEPFSAARISKLHSDIEKYKDEIYNLVQPPLN